MGGDLSGALWLAYFGFVRGWFDFEWLKQSRYSGCRNNF